MMKSDNLKPISPETLDNWQQLGDVAADVIRAALKQRQKAEVSSENN